MTYRNLLACLLLAAAPVGTAAAADPVANAEPMAKLEGDKELSGMSILGNQEAPKALVIVPWKSSEIGDRIGLNDNLDDSRRPVDKEVFLRELRYYEIRSGKE